MIKTDIPLHCLTQTYTIRIYTKITIQGQIKEQMWIDKLTYARGTTF